jgi:hypothetical protein
VLAQFIVDACITSAATEPEQEDCTVTLARQLEGEDIVG